MDETVLSKVARSDAWINLCYQNQEVSQTLVKLGQVVALAANNSTVPNVVKAVLGADSSGADLVRPTAWLNASDSSQTVYYNFSQFAGYSAFDSVPLQIGAGTLNSDYNPIIRVVNNFTPPPISNHATIEEFDVTAGIYDTLSIPFPLQSQYQHTPKEYLLLQHFREDLNKWEILPVDSIRNGLAYAKMAHNGSVAVSNMQDTSADTMYVDSAATGSNNGSSWTNAYTSLQTALTIAADSAQLNTPNLIRKFDFWVAKGTYKPTNDTDRTKSFVVFDHVRMFGGFQQPQTTTLNQRKPAVYKTILSGDISRQGDITDNTYSVVQADSARATIDGFTVTGGNTQGLYIPGNGTRAAGLDICNPRSTVVNNCTFDENNGTNGTVSIWQTVGVLFEPGYHPDTVAITNCAFTKNYGDGGALTGSGQRVLYLQNTCVKQCIIDRCAFVGNYGTSVDAENLYYNKITNCVLGKNSNGSAIYLNNNYSYFRELYADTIENCTFFGNKSPSFGGAIFGSEFPQTAIKNCILWNDSANSGGSEISMSGYEPYMDSNLVHVRNCDIQGGVNGAKCVWEGGLINNGGNINVDPQFADTTNIAGPDSQLATRDDGLRLKQASSCIDTCPIAGAPVTDILGVARPWGSKVDMGAYEYFGPVTINFPLNDTLVGNRTFTIQYTNNKTVYDTTVTLTSDTSQIIISKVDALGKLVSDTETVRLDTKPPVIAFVSPSKDTAVSTGSLSISYTIDGFPRDTNVILNPGVNAITVSAKDSAGNSSSAIIHILYAATANQVFAWAQAPQTAYSYQTIYLDARVTQNLMGFPTAVRWRLIPVPGSNYVCIADSTAALTSVLTRGPDNLAFQLEVMDAAGVLAPAFDTLRVTVKDPVTLFDYLQLLTYNKSGSDNSQQITVTSPGMDASYYTTSDSISLGGTVASTTAADTIYWHVQPSNLTGFFVPQGTDWSGLNVPVMTGDNLITLIYSCDSSWHQSADHLHISKGKDVSFGDLAVNPGVFWIDSLMNFNVQMKTTDSNIASVHLLQVSVNGIIDNPMNDIGNNGDSAAGDGIYSTKLRNVVPVKDSVYFFRVKATANGQDQYSAVYTYLPQTPYSPTLARQILQISNTASSQYYSLKGTIGQIAAMDSVVSWLRKQATVLMAGRTTGGMALCWEFECGVHSIISDVPDGERGSIKYKTKGLSPYLWKFKPSDDCYSDINYHNAYYQLGLDTTLFDRDSAIVNVDSTLMEVTIEDWKNWGKYGTVVVATHGNTFAYDEPSQDKRFPSFNSPEPEFRSNPNPTFNCLLTNVEADTSVLSEYWDDLTSSPIPRIVVGISAKSDMTSQPYYVLTPYFFLKYDQNLDSSLLYIGACRSLYPLTTGGGSLWNAFRARHAKAMLGYTDYVKTNFAAKMGEIIYNRLALGDTLKFAYDSARNYVTHGLGDPSWTIIDNAPADRADPDSAALFKFKGDSNFVFSRPSYIMVNMSTEADTSSFVDVFCHGNGTLFANYANIQPDSFVVVGGPGGQSIPLLNAKFLELVSDANVTKKSSATIRLTSKNVHPRNIYFCANTYGAATVFANQNVVTITNYYHKYDTVKTSTEYLTLGKNIRNDQAGDGYSANPCSDTANWTNIGTYGGLYVDLSRIVIPDSCRGLLLDSMKLSVINLTFSSALEGGVFIQAISVQQ